MTRAPLVITTPRHPIAIAVYAAYVVLSCFYLTDITNSTAVSDVMGGFELVWQIPLLAGALAALTGALLPYKHRLYGLFAESVGAAVLAAEVAVYVWALIRTTQVTIPWATVLVFGAVATGSVVRAVQAMIERGKAVKALTAQLPADPPPAARVDQ